MFVHGLQLFFLVVKQTGLLTFNAQSDQLNYEIEWSGTKGFILPFVFPLNSA